MIYCILPYVGERGTGHAGPLDGLADTLGGWGYLMGSWPLWVVQKIWKRFVKMSRDTIFSNVRGLHSNGVNPLTMVGRSFGVRDDGRRSRGPVSHLPGDVRQ